MSMKGRDFTSENINCLKQFNAMMTVLRAYLAFDEAKTDELNRQLQQRCSEFAAKGGDLNQAHWQNR
jgi:hypothetical protein